MILILFLSFFVFSDTDVNYDDTSKTLTIDGDIVNILSSEVSEYNQATTLSITSSSVLNKENQHSKLQ